jgi:enoyl-CoA hydratase/3-hydroxypropionyl-coenzyme A dehydratase
MSASSALTVETSANGVARVTLNRPHAANAIDDELADALVSALAAISKDENTRAVILSGAGERVFCAGVDLKNPKELSSKALAENRRQRVMRCLDAVLNFERPLVAVLNGVASGAGIMLALLCDVVIARDDSFLQLPEVDVGMPTFLGYECIRLMSGEMLAADLVLSGRRMPFREAAEASLIKSAVAFGMLAEEGDRVAATLAEKPPLPYALNKRWINLNRRKVIDAAGAEALRAQPLLHPHPPHG